MQAVLSAAKKLVLVDFLGSAVVLPTRSKEPLPLSGVSYCSVKIAFWLAKHLVGLFSLRRTTQNASPIQTLHFPCAKRSADLGRSVFLRRGPQNASPQVKIGAEAQNQMLRMLRHKLETWMFLRYMGMLRHESANMDLAKGPEIHMDAKT